MVNLLKLFYLLYNNWVEEESLPINKKVLFNIAKRSGLEVLNKISGDGKNLYSLRLNHIPTIFISDGDVSEFSFLDLSDIHTGNETFDEKKLRNVLKKAVERHVQYVFISGDLFEGIFFRNGIIDLRVAKKAYSSQVKQVFHILNDYDLKYYAINGNHEYTFELFGIDNPMKLIANALKACGKSFTFIDSYIADFIICGVVKRIMHVEVPPKDKDQIPCISRLRSFEKKGEYYTYYKGKKYPIRFFQSGHFHGNFDFYDKFSNVHVTQSGSFIDDNSGGVSGVFLRGKFKNGVLILLRSSA
jgi:hypothetical protein